MTNISHTASDIGLALGTVQFGVGYGIAGRDTPVPEDEVRSILEYATGAGIRILDTAPGYGDIEGRLRLLARGLGFSVVSKVPGLPAEAGLDEAKRFVEESIVRSQYRIGSDLDTILFHRAEDLLGPLGDCVWRAAVGAVAGGVRLGVSCYDPATLIRLRHMYPILVAQLPGNAFDQRLNSPDVEAQLAGIEVHLRSAVLQGLLLMNPSEATRRVPAAAEQMGKWAAWCAAKSVSPLVGALGIVRGFAAVRWCVLGVDSLAQLQEIVSAWGNGTAISEPDLATDRSAIIDPRCWGAE